MKKIFTRGLLALSLASTTAHALVVFSQAPSPVGGQFQSSWWTPDGSDYDTFVWDNFSLNSNQSITQIQWQGGYNPNLTGYGAGQTPTSFTIQIWASIDSNGAALQPDVANLYGGKLAQYTISGDAGQTFSGNINGVATYNYAYTLNTPFAVTSGKNYWVEIVAAEPGIPTWGLSAGTGGNGKHFVYSVGGASYASLPGDTAFTLIAGAVPEADTYAMMLAGLGVVGVVARRRKQAQA